MLQDAERRFRGVLSCEDMGQAVFLGPYQESIVSMTQNCVLVSNIRLQTFVFLSKGVATCRQPVRKSRQTFFNLSVCTSALYLTWILSLMPQQLFIPGCKPFQFLSIVISYFFHYWLVSCHISVGKTRVWKMTELESWRLSKGVLRGLCINVRPCLLSCQELDKKIDFTLMSDSWIKLKPAAG